MNERQLERVVDGRSQLIERLWAIGLPSLRLKIKENPRIKSARTDGTYFEYNPTWAANQSIGQLAYTWLRATGHNLLLHPWRIGWRNVGLANKAGEYAINGWIAPLCKQAGWTMPEDALIDPRFDGLSLEDIYAILEHEQQPPCTPQPSKDKPEDDDEESDESDEGESGDDSDNEQDSDDDDSEQSEGTGGQRQKRQRSSDQGDNQGDNSDDSSDDSGDDSEQAEDDSGDLDKPSFTHAKRPGDASEDGTESTDSEGTGADDGKEMDASEWRNLGAQVDMLARKAGMLPGELDAAMKEARREKIDWKEELREFMLSIIPTFQTWDTPNRRVMAWSVATTGKPLYLPGLKREGTPAIMLFADTSGSTQGFMQTFADEFIGLHRELRPEKTTIAAIDVMIQAVHEYGPDDEPEFPNAGGGGTRFSPAFEWLDQQWEKPACIIYLTDGECYDQPTDPMIPTLWVLPEWCHYNAPFGRVIKIPRVS